MRAASIGSGGSQDPRGRLGPAYARLPKAARDIMLEVQGNGVLGNGNAGRHTRARPGATGDSAGEGTRWADILHDRREALAQGAARTR